MRTAIILNGNIRTWEQTKQSFINSFSELNPDVFLITYDLQYGYHPHIQGVIGDSSDVLLFKDNILRLFDNVNLQSYVINKFREISLEIDLMSKQANPLMGEHKTTIAQYINFYKALRLIEDKERNEEFKYDCIIKTRCDLIYDVDDISIPKTIEQYCHDSVIVDSGNVFPNDCIFIGKRDVVMNMGEFMIQEFFVPKYKDSHVMSPHYLVRNSILDQNIKIIPMKLIKYVLRKDNKIQYY